MMRLSPSWCGRGLLCALILIPVFGLCAPCWAQTTTARIQPKAREYSEFEKERIRRALLKVGGTIDPKPNGKRIESIEVVALDVFEPEDPIPTFINWFHPTTRRSVIEREVLLRVGSAFDPRRSDETERNIRDLLLFSLVVALPLHGSSEGSVRYLIVTKDLWSLRVSWTGRINQGVVDYLSLRPAESNLFGTGRQLFTTLEFGRRTYALGAGYYEPRLGGSRTRIKVEGSAILSCESGDIEGSSGSFEYARPLYSTTTNWSYGTAVSWFNGRGSLVAVNNLRGSICSAKTDEEFPVELPNEKIAVLPSYYLADRQTFSQSFTRSFGYRYKVNLSFGMEAVRNAYGSADLSRVRARDPDAQGALTDLERDFTIAYYERRIPRGEQRISPFFQVLSYTTDFHRDINIERLSLQEDYTLGPVASLRVYPALETLGSTRNLLGLSTSASYAVAARGAYARLALGHDVQLSDPDRTDASVDASFRFVSPPLALGRFVYQTQVLDHYRNYRRSPIGLGGTGRLRGYQATATSGEHYFISNLEYRTVPVQIFSAQLAAVVFHDMGDTFDSFGEVDLLHGVGAGIRFVIPQLDRDVFRIDLGVPVPFDEPTGEVSVIATFGQAF